MKLKLPIIIAGIVLAGAGGWYYWTTTPDYKFAQAKTLCKNNDTENMIKEGVGNFGSGVRELTETERDQLIGFMKISQNKDCPYKDNLAKKTTKTKMTADELKKHGVKDGYKFTFEGEPAEKGMQLVLFNGKWRILTVDASLTGIPFFGGSFQNTPGFQQLQQQIQQLPSNQSTPSTNNKYQAPR